MLCFTYILRVFLVFLVSCRLGLAWLFSFFVGWFSVWSGLSFYFRVEGLNFKRLVLCFFFPSLFLLVCFTSFSGWGFIFDFASVFGCSWIVLGCYWLFNFGGPIVRLLGSICGFFFVILLRFVVQVFWKW